MKGTERTNVASNERYEMRVDWIEVWTLFAVRYTCYILVLHSL
jgi:hypothetical protein